MTNPLLKNSELKDYAVPFDRIKTEHFLPAIEQALQEARQNFALFKDSTADADFSNTIEALEFLDERLSSIAGIYSNLESAHASEEHRALAEKIYPLLTAWGSDVSLDEKLFSKVKYVYDHQNQWPLNQEQKKLLEKTYLSFVRNGALLSAEDKNKLRQIDQDLSVLGPKFSENVLKATNAFELWIDKKEDLAGLPEGVIEAAALSAKQKNQPNKWLFTLQAPSYIPFLTYAKNRDLREKLWRANSSKAYSGDFDNHSNIEKIIQLRHQRALLLGFKNHADFVLQERMAQSSTTVMDFLQKILVASKPAGLKDYQELKTFAAQMDGLQDLQAWDATYYAEKLREQKFSFSEEDLRPYFKLENVIEGVFLHAKKLYGLVFKENSTLPVYHPEVKAYEIFDESSGRYMGLFYTDFFPRETKKGGAWMTEFRSQGLKSTAENKKELLRPHVSIVCNFTKPTDSKPSLLNYDEVRTLFHEFGHALHSILSECTYSSIGGVNVYWDFVELPSQIMENWAAEKESLQLFAKHFQTQESMPEDLIQKIKQSEKFMAGSASCRQVQFGLLDMAWHSADPAHIHNLDLFEDEAVAEARLTPKIPGTMISSSFSHIFAGGYSAGYYSYKWAEVLDADAFEYFKQEGLFNPTVAQKFKDHVLSRGGTEHPMELYKKFRGREPDPLALLRRDGLI